MPTPSTHIGINIVSGGENFSTATYNANWNLIDQFPGIFLCTSLTRPVSWGTNQTGMLIFESDSGLYWQWTGSSFIRFKLKGLLGNTRQTAPVSTASTWTPGGSTGLITVVSQITVIPSGNRTLMVVAEVPKLTNTNGIGMLAIQRDTTVLNWWNIVSFNDGTVNGQGKPGPFITFDVPSTTSSTYSIMMASTVTFGGTTTVTGSLAQPISISVVEI